MNSFLIGRVRTTDAKLVEKFGKPKWGPDDSEDDKVSCGWELSFHDDAGQEHEFNIYAFLKMACEVAAFLEQFPGEAHVVLVHSEQWTECHRAAMEALTEGVRMFLRTHRHLPFEKLLDEFKEN